MSGNTERTLTPAEKAQWERIATTLGLRSAVDLWRWDNDTPTGVEPSPRPYEVETDGL